MIKEFTIGNINEINQLINDQNYIIDKTELKKNARIFILNEKIVGFISYGIFYERAELNYIYVDVKFRGQNIASKLMENMFEECIARNVKTIDLEVSVENIKALNLYKKYDFKIISIRKKYYQGIDAYLMMKEMK